MIPLIFRSKWKLTTIEGAWYRLSSLADHFKEERPRKALLKKVKGACNRLSCLIRVLHVIPSYESLSYIPSGSKVDLLLSLKDTKLTKERLQAALGSESLYLASLLYGIANGYIIAVEDGNRRYVAGSLLRDLLVKEQILKGDAVDPIRALNYLFGGLFLPTRTSLIYLAMKDARNIDSEIIGKALSTKVFTGGFMACTRLALETAVEIVDTGYLGKYERKGVKGKFITPSHAAYVLARTANELIDFEKYKKLLLYVSERRGLASEEAFKNLFKDVRVDEGEVKELIDKDPLLSRIKDLIEVIKKHYNELSNEMSKLMKW